MLEFGVQTKATPRSGRLGWMPGAEGYVPDLTLGFYCGKTNKTPLEVIFP